jgi:hypothetical protein
VTLHFPASLAIKFGYGIKFSLMGIKKNSSPGLFKTYCACFCILSASDNMNGDNESDIL